MELTIRPKLLGYDLDKVRGQGFNPEGFADIGEVNNYGYYGKFSYGTEHSQTEISFDGDNIIFSKTIEVCKFFDSF